MNTHMTCFQTPLYETPIFDGLGKFLQRVETEIPRDFDILRRLKPEPLNSKAFLTSKPRRGRPNLTPLSLAAVIPAFCLDFKILSSISAKALTNSMTTLLRGRNPKKCHILRRDISNCIAFSSSFLVFCANGRIEIDVPVA